MVLPKAVCSQQPKSALGYGVSVLSLTVALSVPNRFDEDSVLSRIKRLAQRTKSDSRNSVQKLVSDTALELLRQDRAIVSVGTDYKHFSNVKDAERQFNVMSLEKRSKFDKETCKFHFFTRMCVHSCVRSTSSISALVFEVHVAASAIS